MEVVLIDKELPLAKALAADAGWQQQFAGETEVVYVRSERYRVVGDAGLEPATFSV